MRILLITDFYYPNIGGGELVMQKIAEFLYRKGYSATVITQRLPNTKKIEILNGVKIIRIKCPSRFLFSIFSIPALIKEARNNDLIFCSTYAAAFPAWLISKVFRKLCIITIHEIFGNMWAKVMGEKWPISWMLKTWEKFIISLKYNAIVVPSVYTYNSLRLYQGIRDENLNLINIGVDYRLLKYKKTSPIKLRKELKLPKRAFLYLFYGRPGISKGLEYLLDAVKIVSQNIKNSKLIAIVSDRPRDRYEMMLKKVKRLKKSVVFLPSQDIDTLAKYLQAVNCIVVPSLAEGFGLTAAESSALGKPLVVSQVASLPEVVTGKAVFVKPGNSSAIAKGIIDVYNKKYQRYPLKRFLWANACQKYIELFKNTIKNYGKK